MLSQAAFRRVEDLLQQVSKLRAYMRSQHSDACWAVDEYRKEAERREIEAHLDLYHSARMLCKLKVEKQEEEQPVPLPYQVYALFSGCHLHVGICGRRPFWQ